MSQAPLLPSVPPSPWPVAAGPGAFQAPRAMWSTSVTPRHLGVSGVTGRVINKRGWGPQHLSPGPGHEREFGGHKLFGDLKHCPFLKWTRIIGSSQAKRWATS